MARPTAMELCHVFMTLRTNLEATVDCTRHWPFSGRSLIDNLSLVRVGGSWMCFQRVLHQSLDLCFTPCWWDFVCQGVSASIKNKPVCCCTRHFITNAMWFLAWQPTRLGSSRASNVCTLGWGSRRTIKAKKTAALLFEEFLPQQLAAPTTWQLCSLSSFLVSAMGAGVLPRAKNSQSQPGEVGWSQLESNL
jgi:hypothetical protein